MSHKKIGINAIMLLIGITLLSTAVAFYYRESSISPISYHGKWHEDSGSIVFYIDEYSKSTEGVHISGWAVDLEKVSEYSDFNIGFFNNETGDICITKTSHHDRPDVHDFLNKKNETNIDYTKSGFSSFFEVEGCLTDAGNFEIILFWLGNPSAIIKRTGLNV